MSKIKKEQRINIAMPLNFLFLFLAYILYKSVSNLLLVQVPEYR